MRLPKVQQLKRRLPLDCRRLKHRPRSGAKPRSNRSWDQSPTTRKDKSDFDVSGVIGMAILRRKMGGLPQLKSSTSAEGTEGREKTSHQGPRSLYATASPRRETTLEATRGELR